MNSPSVCFAEYVVTMFDTKTQELRWNATYNDYSAPPYDEKQDYSTSLRTHSVRQPYMAASFAGLVKCKYNRALRALKIYMYIYDRCFSCSHLVKQLFVRKPGPEVLRLPSLLGLSFIGIIVDNIAICDIK